MCDNSARVLDIAEISREDDFTSSCVDRAGVINGHGEQVARAKNDLAVGHTQGSGVGDSSSGQSATATGELNADSSANRRERDASS